MPAVKGRPAPGQTDEQGEQDDEQDDDEEPYPTVRDRSPKATLGSTTIRVSNSNKELLEQVRRATGARTFDEVVSELVKQSQQAGFPGLDLVSLAQHMGAAEEEGPELAEVVGELASTFSGVLIDPESGVLFKWQKRPNGATKKLPEPDAEGLVRGEPGFFDSPTEAGAWVQAPSGCYLTDRDDTLPDAVAAAIRTAAKEKKRTKK
jgi:hypothetical protein